MTRRGGGWAHFPEPKPPTDFFFENLLTREGPLTPAKYTQNRRKILKFFLVNPAKKNFFLQKKGRRADPCRTPPPGGEGPAVQTHSLSKTHPSISPEVGSRNVRVTPEVGSHIMRVRHGGTKQGTEDRRGGRTCRGAAGRGPARRPLHVELAVVDQDALDALQLQPGDGGGHDGRGWGGLGGVGASVSKKIFFG